MSGSVSVLQASTRQSKNTYITSPSMKSYSALIEKHGSAAAAARSLRIPVSTFKGRLKREKAAPSADNAEAAALLTQLKQARGTRIEPVKQPPKARHGKDDFIRVIIPDSHGDHIARHAAAAFLSDCARLNPQEIVMLGDHLDCGGFLAQHHTMGYVAETETSYEADVMATNQFLDEIQKAAPRATIKYLEGNHEARVEKWCVTQALRNKRDSQFLLNAFGPEAVLGLKQRGIEYYRSSGRYDDLPVPGTIKLGECCFTHGIFFGQHAAQAHASRFGCSIVFGHIHRSQSVVLRTVGKGVIGAWSPGCLAQLQPLYEAGRPTDWTHGYGVQIVARSGKFLHLNIPIIDGESLLLNGGMDMLAR